MRRNGWKKDGKVGARSKGDWEYIAGRCWAEVCRQGGEYLSFLFGRYDM